MKTISQSEKQLRQQNKTPRGEMDLLPGFSEEYNGNSATTDTYITENKMTLHKCQDTQANPLLCGPKWSQDEGTRTIPPPPTSTSLESHRFLPGREAGQKYLCPTQANMYYFCRGESPEPILETTELHCEVFGTY